MTHDEAMRVVPLIKFVELIASRVRLRVGLSHYVTNYTVTDTAASGAPSSRYQRFETVPFFAVAVRL